MSNPPLGFIIGFSLFYHMTKGIGIVFEFGPLDFLIAYAIRKMYNYTVDTSDTQM